MKQVKYLKLVGRSIINVTIIAIFFVPFYWMMLTAFKTLGDTLAFPPKLWVANPHWENFKRVFETLPIGKYFMNSVITTLGILIFQTLTVIPAAYAFARYEFKGKKILFALILVTMMIPAQLVFLPIFLMLSKFNLINSYWSLILPSATSAFGIFMLRQSFMQIPEEIIEAARMDKANDFKILCKIILPIAVPTVITLAMITFIGTWNDYFWPMVLTTTDKCRTLTVGITSLLKVDGGVAHNVVMAGNLILIAPIIIVYIFAQKYIIKGLTYTGIK